MVQRKTSSGIKNCNCNIAHLGVAIYRYYKMLQHGSEREDRNRYSYEPYAEKSMSTFLLIGILMMAKVRYH